MILIRIIITTDDNTCWVFDILTNMFLVFIWAHRTLTETTCDFRIFAHYNFTLIGEFFI